MGEGSLANVQVLSAAYLFLLGPHLLGTPLPSTIVSDISSCELSAHCVHSV